MGRKPKSQPTKSSRTGSRSRSFTGCGTCRRRHIKCDDSKPVCSPCRRLKLDCEGYSPSLLWLAAQGSGGEAGNKKVEGGSFRFPLFTQDDRIAMCQMMVQSLGHQSAEDALEDLDNEEASNDELLALGPFGVFRAIAQRRSPGHTDQTSFQEYLEGDAEHDPEDIQNPEKYTDEDVFSEIHQENGLPCFLMDFPVGEGINSSADTSTVWPTSIIQDIPGLMMMGQETIFLDDSVSFRAPTPQINPSLGSESKLPQHTSALLRYLKTEVFDDGAPATSRFISPWKLLLMPRALETVAEISLWNETSFARRSILLALLAKGAYHMSKSTTYDPSTAQFWHSVGLDHQNQAHEDLKSALSTASKTDDEYGDALMAVMGVGVVSIYYYGPKAIKSPLSDAESLIRSRGLPPTQIFGHRVMHHMYTHLRILRESTNISQCLAEPAKRQRREPDDRITEFDGPRNFALDSWSLGSSLDLSRRKPEYIGFNDMHLDVSGIWHHTLYHEIYGVPETLMTLLSQTISLANEKPRLEAVGEKDPEVHTALREHVRTLEQQIWSWSLHASGIHDGPRRPLSLVEEDTATVDRPNVESMILAMHQALVIFFYRRIYHMNAMVLQHQVRRALDLIQPCLDMAKFDADFSVSISWSTFIAASEAMSSDLQQLALKCLEAVDDDAIFIEHRKPSTIVKTIWEKRGRTSNSTLSWPDVMIKGYVDV